MKKFLVFIVLAFLGWNVQAQTNYTYVPSGTFNVGDAENPGGGKKFTEYPCGGMYLYQAPSGHSFSSGEGPGTGIYTIFSESGIVFYSKGKFDLKVVLDALSFGGKEDIKATLYTISENDFAAIYDGYEKSTEVLLESKDENEITYITISATGVFEGEFTDKAGGFYFIVCSSDNLSNVVYFNKITFDIKDNGGDTPGGGGDDPQPKTKIKVHTIGDSTMAEYDESTTDKRGWGMYLGSFFDSEYVTVNNRGKSGADTRQFYTNANLWASVKKQMSEGDYLLIQFAHNDEGTITYGMDNLDYKAYCEANGLPAPSDARGTNPQTTYREFLRTFIDEAREMGVNPILVGPICRKYFNGNTIRRNGQHDLGDKFSKIEDGVLYENQSVPADDHSMDYVYAMSVVAQEKDVPFINLTAATRDLYLQYGEQQCTQLLFCSGDNTHTATLGANLIARQAAQMLKDADVLAQYIVIPTSVTASPNELSLGDTYSGVQRNSEVLLTGFGLEPDEGTVNIEASGDILISTDKQNFASTAQVDYAGSTLFQRVYIRATYSQSGEQNDSLVITSGETRLVVPVSASVVSLEGGSEVSAYWAIDAKPVPEPIVTGPISAAMTLSYMMAADTKPDFTDGTNEGITMVRFHNADEAGAKTAWPAGEIDENATRYIDFAVTAPSTGEVRITGINMDLASHSTATMCCHINTGFGDDFLDVKTIYERKNFTNLTIEHVALTPTLTIPAGETLHVRILPWHDNAEVKSGKYLCVKDVRIEGQIFDGSEEGVDNILSTDTNRANKILRNGMLLIIHNGSIYSPTGTRMATY